MFKKILLISLSILILCLAIISCSSEDNSSEPEPNIAPTASFTITPSTGTIDTIFQFDASNSSDPEDPTSLLEVRWDFDGDDIYDTNWNTEKVGSFQYSSLGSYKVTMQVRDTEELDDFIEKSIYVSFDNVVPTEMVLIEGGTYEMGDHFNEGNSDELPVHSVTLNNFYIGKYEVTQGQWEDLMGSNPAYNYGVGDNYPVY